MSASSAYVLARRALFDVLETLSSHAEALVLVGAQAVYLHAPGGLSVPEYTTDADVALDADVLATAPDIKDLLIAAGYQPGNNPGGWVSPLGVHVDLMTPPRGSGRHRSARLDGHGRETARQTAGLDVAIADHSPMRLASLDGEDPRSAEVNVASPAALFVAKLCKLHERIDQGKVHRVIAKDAGDVLRLLRMCGAAEIGARLAQLGTEPRLLSVIAPLMTWFREDITGKDSMLLPLVVDAAQGTEDDLALREALVTLGGELLAAYVEGSR